MRRRRHPRLAGFTILELMLVLVIIGVMSALIAPALGAVMANQRARSASAAVHKTIRDARSRAWELGVAHALHYQKTSSGLGRIEIYMGMNRSCIQSQPFFVLRGKALEMTDYNPTTASDTPDESDPDRQVITLRVAASQFVASDPDDLWICYQPNRVSFVSTDTAPPLTLDAQTQTIQFDIARRVNGAQQGVDRQIMVPVSGGPRLQ